MNPIFPRIARCTVLAVAIAVFAGCDVTESARGVLPFMPPSKYIDRGGRKLTRSEAAFYQKLTDLSRATKVNPRDAVAYNAIGELLMKKGSYQLAKRCFQDAIDFDKDLSEPHHNLGRLYLLEERYHGAMEEIKKARDLSRDDAKIRTRLGQALSGLNKSDEALVEFDEAISLEKDYTPAYLEKARLYYKQHNYAEAAEVCRTALNNIPPYEPPPAAIQKQTNIGLLDKVLPNQKVYEDDSAPPTYKEEAAYDLALCLKAQGLYGEALSALAGAETAADGRADVQILKAKLEDQMGNTGGALATLALLRTAIPDMAEVPKLMARFQVKMGQTELAAKTRLEAAELDQSDKDLQEEAAQDAEAKHNKPRMIQLYERLSRIEPEVLRYRIQLAQAYDDAGIRREAALAWQEVVNLRERVIEQQRRDGDIKAVTKPDPFMINPSEYDVRRRCGMLDSDIPGFQGKAMIHFKRCLELQPNDAEVHRRFGELLLLNKNFGEAERHIRETLRVAPNDAKSHQNLATLHAAQSRYDDAVDEYRKAIALDPKLEVAQFNLTKVLLGQNRREEALEPLRTYILLKPLDIDARRMLADLYRDLNNREAALAELSALSVLEAENIDTGGIVLTSAPILRAMGEKNTAISDLEAQIEKHPSELRLLLAVGRYYSEDKLHLRAIFTWERVLNIAGNDDRFQQARAEALTRLATEYDAIGRKDEAIKMNELAGRGGDAEGWRRAGEMYLQKNDNVKALAAFRQVITIKNQDVDARRQIAELIQQSPKLNEREEALKLYQDILTLVPKDERARVNYANILTDFNRFTEAQENFDLLIRDNPKNTSAYVGRGVTFRKRAKYKDALQDYLKAIEIDPTLAKAYFNAGLIYDYYLKDPEKAKQAYQKYIDCGGDPAKLPKDTDAAPEQARARPAPSRNPEAAALPTLRTLPNAETIDLDPPDRAELKKK